MLESVRHRGPNDSGIYQQGGVSLAQARLSIIDLSPAGHQPMSNEDGSIWLVCNGEIYNYLEIRKGLMAKGHSFSSQTDSEVILHLYEEEGEACLDKFDGMFAFALWDSRRGRLFLARDRAGEKPLYYHIGPDFLVFASEPKGILAAGLLEPAVDLQALAICLTYSMSQAPYVIFKGMRQLPPAHFLSVHAQGADPPRGYWDLLDVACRTRRRQTDRDWDAEFSVRFRNSVRQCIRSDAPFGAFLSGGLDSSAVVRAMVEEVGSVRTFSFGFEDASFDETETASEIAGLLGASHQVIRSRPTDLPTLVEKAVLHGEDYTANPTFIPVYLLCQGASKTVKMVLSGDGADELFAGYETYRATHLAGIYKRLPDSVRTILRRAAEALPASNSKMPVEEKLKRFVFGSEHPGTFAHALWRYIFKPSELSSLLSKEWFLPDFDPTHVYCENLVAGAKAGWLEGLQYADFHCYMPNDALVRSDRMGMAHGLEVRAPFLSRDMIEFAFELPEGMRMADRKRRKVAIRRFLRDRLPARIINMKKQGFNAPVESWLRGPLRDMLQDHLSPDRVKSLGFFNVDTVSRLMVEHLRGQANHGRKLWNLLCFSIWTDRFLKAGQLAPINAY